MRKNDDNNAGSRYFRAGDRFFRVGDEWFYTTREGNEGPFNSRELADRHLSTFIDLLEMRASVIEKAELLPKEEVRGDPTVWGRQLDII